MIWGQLWLIPVRPMKKSWNKSYLKIREEALNNLKEITPSLKIETAEDSKICFVESLEFTSEKILDKDVLLQIQDKLDAEDLLIGVPYQGILIAISNNAPIKMKFPNVIKRYYEYAENDRISPNIFVTSNGTVIGMGGENLSLDDNTDNIDFSEDSYGNYTVYQNPKNPEDLVDQVNTANMSILAAIMSSKKFVGIIKYIINDNVELTDALRNKALSARHQIKNNEMLKVLTTVAAKKDINPIFQYKDEPITASGGANAFTENQTKYSKFSLAELDNEFDRIMALPNAHNNVDALRAMTQIRKEYHRRGRDTPEKRSKKWWQFWK